jgi:hypothetical protein
MNELNRDRELFLDIDLARRAAISVGIDPNKPYLTLAHCAMDEVGVTFSNRVTVKWDDLGLGNLHRIDRLFSEYLTRPPTVFKQGLEDLGSHFRYSPNEARWFFKESSREQLFQVWGNQLGASYASMVL